MSGSRRRGRPFRLQSAVQHLALAALFALGSPNAAAAAEERVVVLGTAPVAGVYFPAGGAVCRLVNLRREVDGLRCLVESTDGSAENLRRLRSGDLDFALLQSDWQFHAYRGSGNDGGEEPFEGLRAVFSLHAQPLTVVAARESGIAEFADLAGKRVNLGVPGSAVRSANEILIQGLGWSYDSFAEVNDLDADEQVDALCAGLVDAFVLPTSHPNGIVTAATEGCLARLVPVTGGAVERLTGEWPFYAAAVIPGGLYRGNPDDVASFGVQATLVTTADTPADVVHRLVAAVFDDLDQLRRWHPALAGLEPEGMIAAGNAAPLHDGALRYYRERGWR